MRETDSKTLIKLCDDGWSSSNINELGHIAFAGIFFRLRLVSTFILLH